MSVFSPGYDVVRILPACIGGVLACKRLGEWNSLYPQRRHKTYSQSHYNTESLRANDLMAKSPLKNS